MDQINYEDFIKADLRVALINKAERVEGSEKLLRLEVEVGDDGRQIVAGIGKSYTPEEIIGKQIVIVANLKPRKLMGVESQGMLLAASDETEDEEREVILLTTMSDIKSGSKVG